MHVRKFGWFVALIAIGAFAVTAPDSFAAGVNSAWGVYHLQQSPSPSDPNQNPNSPNNNPNGPNNNNPGTPNNPNGPSNPGRGRNPRPGQPDRPNNPNQPNGQPNGPNDPGGANPPPNPNTPNPSNPNTPSNPNNPGTPGEPNSPSTPHRNTPNHSARKSCVQQQLIFGSENTDISGAPIKGFGGSGWYTRKAQAEADGSIRSAQTLLETQIRWRYGAVAPGVYDWCPERKQIA